MKKYVNVSFVYAIFALICGVFYREFTKLNGFTGKTTLGVMHVHLFVLGTILFLIIGLYSIMTNIETQKEFKRFFTLYNISLPFMVIMFMVRGIVQVLGMEVSTGMNAAISGIAGISHILMMVSIIFLFLALKKCQKKA
ncbi:DUF2871 domain-containing protein [Erysipelotrichaceae bacterium HCN-30851]